MVDPGLETQARKLVNSALLAVATRIALATGTPLIVAFCLWGANSLYNIQLSMRDMAGTLSLVQQEMSAMDKRVDRNAARVDLLEARFNAFIEHNGPR